MLSLFLYPKAISLTKDSTHLIFVSEQVSSADKFVLEPEVLQVHEIVAPIFQRPKSDSSPVASVFLTPTCLPALSEVIINQLFRLCHRLHVVCICLYDSVQ